MLLDELLAYSLRVIPGLVLLAVAFLVTPKSMPTARVFLLILGFILLRDAMTPMGFWQLARTGAAFWIRFRPDALLLFLLGTASLALTAGVLWAQPALRELVRWGTPARLRTWLSGLVGALVVLVPTLALSAGVPLEARGGAVARSILPALLFMCLAGNLMEEVLFRGLLQGRYEQLVPASRAALLSGLTFAAGHIFLSATVTDLGGAVLAFTLFEGLVCAEVRRREGVIASTLTHGLAIFGLSAALL